MQSARRLAGSSDSRILLAGTGVFLGLVVYLAVVFATTHPVPPPPLAYTAPPNIAAEIAPWKPVYASKQPVPVPLKRGGFAVRVRPKTVGTYGALVPTLVDRPPAGHRFVVSLWLRGSRPGQIGILLDKFRPGAKSIYLVDTTVPATLGWHHVTSSRRVAGRWLGVGLFISRNVAGAPAAEARHHVGDASQTWFEVRDLTVKYH